MITPRALTRVLWERGGSQGWVLNGTTIAVSTEQTAARGIRCHLRTASRNRGLNLERGPRAGGLDRDTGTDTWKGLIRTVGQPPLRPPPAPKKINKSAPWTDATRAAGERAYLCRLTLSVLPCCCDTMADTGCGARGSRRGTVTTCCRSWSRCTGSCRAGGECVNRSGDSAAGSGRRPSTGSSAVSATAAQTP